MDFSSKHMSGICLVSKMKVIWGQADTNECPRCGHPEDVCHITRCTDPSAMEEWNQQLADLDAWMTSVDTSPDVVSTIRALLQVWRGGTSFPYQVPCLVLLAAKDQRIIGCRGLLEGLISPKWAITQDQHYRDIGSRRTGA